MKLPNRPEAVVHIENNESHTLLVGNQFVTQGSMLSCLLYLIFILDIPDICHTEKHNIGDYRKCSQPNISTFIDNNYVKVRKTNDKSLEDEVYKTMDKIKTYMDSNKLA